MKITATTLGLSADASAPEILAALGAKNYFTESEMTEAKNTAAAGARKTAESKAKEDAKKSGKLSEEEMKEYKEFKTGKVISQLRKNKVLAKFDEEDFDLIVKAERLASLKGEDLDGKIKDISKTYAKRMKNDLPKQLNKPETKTNDNPIENKQPETKVTEHYVPGSLGIFDK